MKLDLNLLTEFFESNYFEEFSENYTLKERQQNPTNLSSVNIITSGHGLFIKPKFLCDCLSIYRKIDDNLSFRDNNDGTFVLEDNGKQYLIYIEMKSGYGAVKKKAIRQIPVSAIKVKSFLRNFKAFNPHEYIELGLIISYPPTEEDKYDSGNNAMVIDHKLSYMAVQTGNEDVIDKELRQNKKTFLKAECFPKLSQDKLHEDIRFKSMMVYHCPVNGNNETVNLDEILH